MLNSVSSATNAAPVSSLSSAPVSAASASSLSSPIGKALMMSFNCVRSAVKSVFTWRTVEYSMMATRSAVRHLGVDELQRRLLRAQLLGNPHRREIEEHHHQALVVILHLAGCFRGDGGLGRLRYGVHVVERRRRRRRRRLHGEFLNFEDRDLLRLAVFEHREIVLREAVDGLAGLVLHGDVHDHQVGVGGEGDSSGRRLRRLPVAAVPPPKHQERRETVDPRIPRN